jgi:Beta-propeller repeat
MRVFGRRFQKTIFAVAVVGLSNWGFWLPTSLPATRAPITTQRRIATFPSAKPSVSLPASTVAKSEAKISVVADNESTPNVSSKQQVTAGVNALHLPSLSPRAAIPAVMPADQAEKSRSQASTALGALSPGFIENRGQYDEHVKFQLRGNGKTVWLTDSGLVFDAMRGKPDATGKETPSPDSSANSSIPPGVMPPKNGDVPQSKERLVFNEEFLNTNGGAKIEASDPQQGVYNFIAGNDPAKWQTNVQAYGEIVYHDVWEGIDVRVYRNGSNLEQEFIVRPGGDLNRVQIAYRGIEGLNISPDGLLEIQTAFGKLQETRPRIYQEIAGNRVEIEGRFKLLSETSYTFAVAPHPTEYALVIDPSLLYSTFLGGSAGNNIYTFGNQEVATGVGVDASGEAVVAGYTASTDFPTTPGAFQVSPPSGSFVTKLNATGSALVYSTYLGYSDTIQAIAVDSTGDAYVTGYTSATYYGQIFPTTPNAYWPTNSNQQCSSTDFFVSELNPSGNGLVYSSCFDANPGEGYYPRAIAVDTIGRVFVTGGDGSGLPTTANAYQPSFPGGPSAFISVFDTTISGPSSLVYSTYFGLPSNSSVYGISGNAIAVDSFGSAYLTGFAGPGMPVTPGAFQSAASGAGPCNPYGGAQVTCPDAFVAKFNPSAVGTQSLIYSTYLGGPGPTILGTRGNGIAVDVAGNAYVTGNTGSANFPVTFGAFQTTPSCGSNLFITKLNTSGSSLVYSTYLGSSCYANNNSSNGIAVDSLGDAYVAGGFRAQAQSTFPVTADAFQSTFTKLSGDFGEAFLTKLNATGSSLLYSTYLGGSGDDVAAGVAVDQTGDAYITGHTSSADLPVTPGVFQSVMDGTGDAFVAKFSLSSSSQALQISPNSGGNAGSVTVSVGGSFLPGTTIMLVCLGSPNIAGTNVAESTNIIALTATFNLVGAAPGTCDVVITNPDGSKVTRSGAFTVVQGGAPSLTIDIVGRSQLRAGIAATYYLVLRNQGNIDAGSTLISFAIPTFMNWQDSPNYPMFMGNGNGGAAVLEFAAGSVPAGATIIAPVNLNAPDLPQYAHLSFNLLAVVGEFVESDLASLESLPSPISATPSASTNTGAQLDPNSTVSLDTILLQQGCPFLPFACPQCNTQYLDELTQHTDSLLLYNTWQDGNTALYGAKAQMFSAIAGAAGAAAYVAILVPLLAPLIPVASTSAANAEAASQLLVGTILDTIRSLGQQVILGQNNWPMIKATLESNLNLLQLNMVNIAASGGGSFLQTLTSNIETKIGVVSAGIDAADAVIDGYYNAELQRDNAFAAFNTSLVSFRQAQQQYQACIISNCGPQPPASTPPTSSGPPAGQLPVGIIVSGDPNEKTGPLGVGTQQWVSGSAPLQYAVYFSNEPTATAPAQTVTVTDEIPLSLDDITTFQFGPFAVGNQLLSPPPGNIFSNTVDLRPALNLLVGVSASFNPSTGQVEWQFTSLDPSTQAPTTNPVAGFLPPGGSGSLFFTIMPRAGLPTGAQIQNQATVVFDANAPINTPTWMNTIDNTSPTSQVASLPATEGSTNFSVQWSGSDVGAGIQDFTVYSSDNGAPFTAWLTNTTSTSSTFAGQLGHTYSFYSIARDLVGNVEASKNAAEATTQVALASDTTPPVTSASPLPSPNGNGWNNSDVVISINSSDSETGGTGVKQITYSAIGAQNMASTVVAGASTSLTVSAEGITTITFFGADNAGNIEAAKTIIVRIDKTPPNILGSRTPPANANGWNNSNVTVSFTCSDSLSGLAAGSPPAPMVLSTEGAGQSVAGACQDLAGNSAGATVGGINIDKTPPILTASVNPPPNANGWNNSPTTVSFAAVDSLSGVALVSAPVTVSVDGAGQIVTGSAADLAGNVTSGSATIYLDQTPPDAFVQFDPSTKDILFFGRDSLSGVAPGPVTPISVQLVPDTDYGGNDTDRRKDEDSKKTKDRRAELRTYQVLDLAGNSLLLVVEIGRHEESETVRLVSVQYNGGAVLNLPRNEETFEWEFDRDGTLSELHQTINEFTGENSQQWDATYESRHDTTTIEQESPGQKQKIIVPGLDLLQITTSNGQLLIEH